MRYALTLVSLTPLLDMCGNDVLKNSSSEHKISVCKRIAERVIPAVYALNGTAAGERVKSKISA